MAAEHAAFFATLPAGDLLPMELALRQVLVDWLHAKPGPFPLIEWIDRRIGGEVETRRDSMGLHQITLRGAPPAPPGYGGSAAFPPTAAMGRGPPPAPPGYNRGGALPVKQSSGMNKEKFFASLPTDKFGAKEQTLREAVFEFLASWESNVLAKLKDLVNSPLVQKHVKAFLPDGVNLKDWIEKRIGGEVEIKEPQETIALTSEGKRLVREKYQQLKEREISEKAMEPASKDSFFTDLPADELLPAEIELRQEILGFLAKWRKSKPGWPTISDLQGDPKITSKRTALLPKAVKIRSWIERRIGGEIELKKDERGGQEHHVMLRGSEPPLPEKTPGIRQAAAPAQTHANAAKFLEELPADELLDAEQDLRATIIQHLEGKPSMLLAECTRDPDVKRCKEAFIPVTVSLQAWINKRIGGEVEIAKDGQGRPIVRLREAQVDGAMDEEQLDGGLDATESFIASLPGDEFSDVEGALRDALLAFLQNWRGHSSPTLAQAKGDMQVARQARLLIPPGVDLSSWIQRRIGGEIEVKGGPADNRTTISLVGAAPPMQDSNAKRQRRNR